MGFGGQAALGSPPWWPALAPEARTSGDAFELPKCWDESWLEKGRRDGTILIGGDPQNGVSFWASQGEMSTHPFKTGEDPEWFVHFGTSLGSMPPNGWGGGSLVGCLGVRDLIHAAGVLFGGPIHLIPQAGLKRTMMDLGWGIGNDTTR